MKLACAIVFAMLAIAVSPSWAQTVRFADGIYLVDLTDDGPPNAVDQRQRALHLQPRPLLSLNAVITARVARDAQTGEYVVAVQMDDVDGARFGEITRQHVNDRIAIVVAGEVRAAPMILEPIESGSFQINVRSESEGEEVARRLLATDGRRS